jgi:hypothetical protein
VFAIFLDFCEGFCFPLLGCFRFFSAGRLLLGCHSAPFMSGKLTLNVEGVGTGSKSLAAAAQSLSLLYEQRNLSCKHVAVRQVGSSMERFSTYSCSSATTGEPRPFWPHRRRRTSWPDSELSGPATRGDGSHQPSRRRRTSAARASTLGPSGPKPGACVGARRYAIIVLRLLLL